MNPEISESEEATPTTNAVSIFGQGGSANDFPVLKAFQEYIDAEQAKARKRMLGLSIFFILLLVVIVIAFAVVVMLFINRNQSLSDRLLDIALREKLPAQPVVTVQSPAPAPVVQPVVHQPSQEVTLKPVMEKFDKLAEALIKAQQQPVSVAQPAPVVVTTSPQPVVQSAAESAELIRLREELRREREERKAEKEAKEKEAKRQAEIEAHRRRLYPEYYAQQEARKVAAENERRAPAPLPKPVTQPVPQAVTQPVPQAVPQPVPQAVPPAPVVKPKAVPTLTIPPSPQPAPEASSPAKLKPRSYFSDSMPSEDPELKELLKKVPPVSSSAQQPKPQAQPAPKPVPKNTVPKPVQQPVAKPLPQPAVKPVPQPAVQPPSKPAQKPPAPATPAAKPVVQVPKQEENKTETLTIGGSDGNSIPWLIEIPQN